MLNTVSSWQQRVSADAPRLTPRIANQKVRRAGEVSASNKSHGVKPFHCFTWKVRQNAGHGQIESPGDFKGHNWRYSCLE